MPVSIAEMSQDLKKYRVMDSPDPDRPIPEPEVAKAKLRLGVKAIDEVNRPYEATTRPIVVHELLAQNLTYSMRVEKPLDLNSRISRRTRDYWILMFAGNSPLAVELLYPGLFPFAFIWSIIFSVMFTWVMWLVMSDY